MDYKVALGKSFIDPADLRSARLDLATINPEDLHAIADVVVRSSEFTPSDGDFIAKVARIIQRLKHDLGVTDLEALRAEPQ
ncbi:MAG: hypothetical protein NTW48_08385 [Chloroflexi bacterium]|nr:hypothetical protein [Chloroflexota bacterium]